MIGRWLASAGLALSLSCAEPAPDRVVVALDTAPVSLDPRFASSDSDGKVSRLIFAGLTTTDTDDGAVALDLAESWEPEGSGVLVRLRRDRAFHDGTPVTAADVAWSLRSITDPAVGSPYASTFRGIEPEVVDDTTLRIRLSRPHPSLAFELEVGIVPQHAVGPNQRFDPGEPWVGAGPFAWVRTEADGTVVLRPQPWTKAGRAGMRELVVRPMPDENARLMALASGRVDLVQNAISPLLLPVAASYPDLRVEQSRSFKYSYLAFETSRPPFDDVRVRRAVAMAIDRAPIIATRFAGAAVPAQGMIAPWHPIYAEAKPPPGRDLDAARRLLDEAGIAPADQEGCRLRVVYKTSTNKFRRGIAGIIAGQLREAGICVEVRSLEWGTFFDDIKSGNFELTSLSWPSVQDDALFRWVFHSASIPDPSNRSSGANRGRFRSARVDAAIERAESTRDPAARRAAFAEVQGLLSEELPYVSLWYEDNVVVVRRQWQGFAAVPNGRLVHLADMVRAPRP